MERTKRIVRHNRIRARLTGTAERPRASVYRSLTRVSVQLIDDVARKTVVAVHGSAKKGVDKMAQAKSVGNEVAKAALAKDIKAIVFDRSGYLYHGRIKALADAMREGGLDF
jgi:large subunit ribosomal protein L18